MRIVEFQTWLVHVPTHSQLKTSYGEAEGTRPHVVVKLTDDEGHVGFGEASPLPQFTGETATSIRLQLDEVLLPAVVGRDPFDHDEIIAALDERLPENRSAKCAIDLALYDLRGQILCRPVFQQLGGLRRSGGFPVTRAIGIGTIDEVVEKARHWSERGFKTLKLKVGLDPIEDVERIRAVRQSVPDDVRIRIDANQGMNVPDAIRVARALVDVVEYFEQPVPAWDLAGLREIRQATGVRLGLDESVHTLHDLLRALDARAIDVLMIKLIKCGGLRAAECLAGVARSANVPVVIVSPFETHIGAAAGVHLAMTLEPSPFAQELSIFCVEPTGPRTASSLEVRGSTILPPSAPGLGASFVESE